VIWAEAARDRALVRRMLLEEGIVKGFSEGKSPLLSWKEDEMRRTKNQIYVRRQLRAYL
jgi:hypothetical protein